jgi:hypothetical protein
MTAKIIKKKEEGEDFLGLITLGSLIANLFQHASKKSLEEQHIALKSHYENMLERYKQIYNAYMSMKRVNEGLTQEVRTLNAIISKLWKENNRLLEENIKLKDVKTEGPIRRRRRISFSRKIS